jgi:hypothetical protein
MAESKHPMLVGAAIGALGVLVWFKRGWIVERFHRAASVFRGPGDGSLPSLDAGAGAAIRHIRRYAFAASQDKSPVVGLTHASYALMCLDLLEETVGRSAIAAAGYDPTKIRSFITALQDKHGEALRSCDPFMHSVLEMERGEGKQLPGFVPA